MTGFLGNYADNQILHGADLNADSATLAANDAAILNTLTGGWNLLVSGCALSAPGGLVVDVASGQAVANGVILTISAGSVTLVTNSGQANPRVDVVYAQLLPGGASGTNSGSGNPTKADTYVLGVQQGTNAASPVAPTLPGATYVQLGLVNVPAGATSIASGNLGSQTTAPNAQGPVGPILVNMLLHMAASMATATVHGFQASAAGATGPGRLLVGDATFGAAGAALDLVDQGGALRSAPAYNSGSHPPGGIPLYNANGRIEDSEELGGEPPAYYATAAASGGVQANLNSHESASPKTAAGVHNLIEDCGSKTAQTVNNQNASDFAIAFNFTQPDTNYRILAQWVVSSPFSVGYGGTTQVWNKTTTGCSVRVTQNSGANQAIGLDWFLIR